MADFRSEILAEAVEIFNEQKDYSKALELALKAFEIACDLKDKANCMQFICDCYIHLGDLFSARRYALELIELIPDWGRPYWMLGQIYSKLEKYEKAEHFYKKAIEVDPYVEDNYFQMGSFYYSRNMYAKAASYYQQAIRLDNCVAESHSNLGM